MYRMFDVENLFQKVLNVQKVCQSDKVEGFMAEGMPYGDHTNKFFFWVGKPEGDAPDGGWPAIVLVHGGGGCAIKEWVEFWNVRGYVAISMDLYAQKFNDKIELVPNDQFKFDGSWGSFGCGKTNQEFTKSWTYMNVCDIILCHNYVRNLPYVNPEKTVATGISWGGYLTSITAGVDSRFKAFAPVYGCGMMYEDTWALPRMEGFSDDQMHDWAFTYDPTAYMPFVKRPILYVSGMTDSAFSAVAHKKTTNLIKGKVKFGYSANLDHGHYFDLTPGVQIFFDNILKANEMPFEFLSANSSSGKITVEVDKPIKTAKLFTTKSVESDSHVWVWESQDVALQAGVNQIAVPEGTVAALVSAYIPQNDQAVFSTDVFIFGDIKQLS